MNQCRSGLQIISCIVISLVSANTYAATWRITPSLETSLTYTDNVALSPAGLEENDLIYQVNPRVSITAKGRRLKLFLDYRMQNVAYQDHDKYNDTFHQLNSYASYAILEKSLFLDVGAQYKQQNLSNTSGIPFDNLAINTHRTDTASININPYYLHQISSYADLKLSYEYHTMKYSETNADSVNHGLLFSLKSGRSFQRLIWEFLFYKQKIQPADRGDSTLEKYHLDTRYKLTRRLHLLLKAGYENNDYPHLVSLKNPKGEFWLAGFSWVPSRRTTVDISAGRRFYGDTYSFLLTHRARRTDWRASYSEDITSVQQQALYEQTFIVYDSSGNPVFNPALPGQVPLTQTLEIPAITTELYIRKRAEAAMSFRTAKSKLDASVYNERRIYQETNLEEKVYGLYGKWNWRLIPRTRLIFSANGYITEFAGSSRKDGVAQLGVSLERRMRKKVTGYVDLFHNRLDSNQAGIGFKQNLIAARLLIQF